MPHFRYSTARHNIMSDLLKIPSYLELPKLCEEIYLVLPKSIQCKEACSSGYSCTETDILSIDPWGRSGNSEPNQLAKPFPVCHSRHSQKLVTKGPNSSSLCSSGSSLVPLYFSVPDGSHGLTTRLSSHFLAQ